MAKIKPLGNRILIQRKAANTSKGGIYLPETAQEKPKEGVVVAKGEKVADLKNGDHVYFTSYSGSEVSMDGNTEHLILSEDDVLCVVES